MANEKNMTETEQQQWVKAQYQVATKYLAEKGLVTQSVAVEDSRYLIPYFSVWKLKSLEGKTYWVICGDVTTDYMPGSVAESAREAVRHFSFKWQLQAENLMKEKTKEQQEFAQYLIGRAEGIYDLYKEDALWQENATS